MGMSPIEEKTKVYTKKMCHPPRLPQRPGSNLNDAMSGVSV